MSEIPFIVYERDGVPAHLFGERDWRDAIHRGDIRRHTIVGLFRAGGGRQDMAAGDVPELRPLFDAFEYGRAPDVRYGPTPGPAMPPDGPAGNAQGKILIGLGATVAVLLAAVLGVTLLGRQTAAPAIADAGTQPESEVANKSIGVFRETAETPRPPQTGNTVGAAFPASTGMTPVQPSVSLESRALATVNTYFGSWAPSNDVSWIGGVYAGSTNYYGSIDTPSAIMSKQSATIYKWPSRSFRLDPGQTRVSCDHAAQRCTVTGWVRLQYQGGYADPVDKWSPFSIVMHANGGGMTITSETNDRS